MYFTPLLFRLVLFIKTKQKNKHLFCVRYTMKVFREFRVTSNGSGHILLSLS